ncbi:ABC transporter substrate-binding protein [Microvirga lotononidis]|uniref:ABC-type sugar transport system, periplasmic component n=1 Tax=Microvirga lotononidis TaxID=864069 RepID=I4YWP1_9HYPH|nr:sugar ABC transporter substrate-binding protein [Microvirga lotononidis]EIM28383.1 ABC-type sugar transport system, periplasmic component [Microvirga lotononidis]WQO27533.1 sugar ABC transporter substrate-binding protein [Microvirga lotononidis]
MLFRNIALLSAVALVGGTSCALAQGQTLTIATVNNADMIIMQRLSPKWEQATGNKLNWVVLEENVLRQRATTDIATKGGQFDIITIGSYETPIWGKQNWLVSLDDLGNDYDYGDLIPTVKSALSANGKLYSLPFYAESSFTFYRKDLFDQAGLKMPDKPTYDQISEYAAKLTDKSKEQYGFCQRGKPGWGENMAFIGPMVNAFGGRWFNEKWEPQLTTEPWKNAINYYVKNMREYGPPGATANGHNENRALFATGHCGMWVDATSAAGYIYNPKESQVADKTAFAPAPVEVTSNGSAWFWAWALAVPASSKKVDAAKSFLKWATSKDYITLVGNEVGWVSVPPGTRKSTYDNPEYQKAAPFAKIVYDSIVNADITKPTKDPVPYVGIQYVAIPEFQGIGTAVGQQIAAALAGQVTVDQALENAQRSTERTMKQAGYPK